MYAAITPGKKRVYALDLATGAIRWTSRIGSTEALVADGDLLLLGNYGRLWRYVPRSGHLVWSWPAWVGTSGKPPTPVVADGTWYAFGGEYVVARDARTAAPRWQRDFGCFNCDVAATGGGCSSPASPMCPMRSRAGISTGSSRSTRGRGRRSGRHGQPAT